MITSQRNSFLGLTDAHAVQQARSALSCMQNLLKHSAAPHHTWHHGVESWSALLPQSMLAKVMYRSHSTRDLSLSGRELDVIGVESHHNHDSCRPTVKQGNSPSEQGNNAQQS